MLIGECGESNWTCLGYNLNLKSPLFQLFHRSSHFLHLLLYTKRSGYLRKPGPVWFSKVRIRFKTLEKRQKRSKRSPLPCPKPKVNDKYTSNLIQNQASTKLERKTSVNGCSVRFLYIGKRRKMGSMFSGNRLNKEEMEVVMNKAKEIVSQYPVVVFRSLLFQSSCLFPFFSSVIMLCW